MYMEPVELSWTRQDPTATTMASWPLKNLATRELDACKNCAWKNLDLKDPQPKKPPDKHVCANLVPCIK